VTELKAGDPPGPAVRQLRREAGKPLDGRIFKMPVSLDRHLFGREAPRPPSRPAHARYQCTPFITCANASASVVGALSLASLSFPFAACESGKSLYARFKIVSLAFGATA
jgi:hypothetical protein